ncbi:hypothetical protein BH20CHL6_BH20CHL6_11910 [soil metagenome]
MSSVSLDRILAFLVLAIATTGLLSLRAGASGQTWVFIAHGLLGGALLVAVVVKLWRSVPRAAAGRHWRRLALGLFVGVVALAATGIGFAAVGVGELLVVGPWTLISWHAAIGLLLVPLVLAHLLPRRWRLLRPRGLTASWPRGGSPSRSGLPRHGRSTQRVSRRTVLAAGALGLMSLALWGGANLLDTARGGVRRFTGSRWLTRGGIPPATTFFGEGADPIDPRAWRLTVGGRVARPLTYGLAELAALGERDDEVVLDCTSGWAMQTTWSGVPLGAVLDAAQPLAGAQRVDVRSVTGWGAALSLDDARQCLLATRVAGEALPHGNGAPCRLVVPDRRGLDWVKWVVEVTVV